MPLVPFDSLISIMQFLGGDFFEEAGLELNVFQCGQESSRESVALTAL